MEIRCDDSGVKLLEGRGVLRDMAQEVWTGCTRKPTNAQNHNGQFTQQITTPRAPLTRVTRQRRRTLDVGPRVIMPLRLSVVIGYRLKPSA